MAGYEYKLVSGALTTDRTVSAWDGISTPFAERVCKELRVKMHPRDSQSYWIYRDDCPYVLGWVGYGDYQKAGDGTPMYVVQARTIVNGKYAEHHHQQFMKMSTNFNVAVRNAKKFIRMMSPHELAATRLRDASNAVNDVVGTAYTRFAETRNVLDINGIQPALLTELRHLMNSNHKFIDAMFGENLATFFAKQDEWVRLKQRTVLMRFIRVYDRADQQVFDVIDIDPEEYGYQPRSIAISGEAKRYTADTLPEDIMQKLSVLNILQANDYVDDVGFSAGDGMFYVVQ